MNNFNKVVAFSIPHNRNYLKFIHEVQAVFDAVDFPYDTSVEVGHQESNVEFLTTINFVEFARKYVKRISKERDSEKLRKELADEIKAAQVLYGVRH